MIDVEIKELKNVVNNEKWLIDTIFL